MSDADAYNVEDAKYCLVKLHLLVYTKGRGWFKGKVVFNPIN